MDKIIERTIIDKYSRTLISVTKFYNGEPVRSWVTSYNGNVFVVHYDARGMEGKPCVVYVRNSKIHQESEDETIQVLIGKLVDASVRCEYFLGADQSVHFVYGNTNCLTSTERAMALQSIDVSIKYAMKHEEDMENQ